MACALLVEEREPRAAAECELARKTALQPQRDRRMLKHERAERLAAESHASMRKEAEAAHWAELKRLRAAREVRQLKAEDAHAERIARMSVGCVRVPWDLRVRVVINY